MSTGVKKSRKAKNTRLNVEGMSCTNCALGISRYLEKQGLEQVYVDFTQDEVSFQYDAEKELQGIIEGIEKLGYRVVDQEHDEELGGLSTVEKKFLFTLIWTIPLFISMFFKASPLRDPYVQLILCLPVFAVGFWHFGKSALASLRTGVPNMDVLITLGSSAAFFYSLAGTLLQLGEQYLFYETAATIISLVLLGNVLEHRSVRQTSTALRELGELQADKARLIVEENGQESSKEVPIGELKLGDRLLVNSGDVIPLDGSVEWGNGAVDESMITGESMPVSKSPGDQLIGGTILRDGTFKFHVTAVGGNTVLSNIVRMVRAAQASKPSIQRLADTVSAYFVPIVIAIAIITFVLAYFVFNIDVRQALLQSVAVLVIACPCAMGLATPTAVMVGLGPSARNGILVKGGKTLETLAQVKQVVFDKTGTLTSGKFQLQQLITYDFPEDQARRVIYKLEQHSSHPIASSLLNALGVQEPISWKTIEEQKGLGISAVDQQGDHFQIGSHRLLKENNGQHDLYLLKNGHLIGGINIEDDLKEGAQEVIDYFKEKGIKTIILSGDNIKNCRSVAERLGIEEYYGEQLPDEKLEVISRLTAIAPTAMVGDGINDAPALTQSTVGISLSNATKIARDAAEVILLNGRLEHLKVAFATGQHTLLTIKQNLFWAFFYNVAAIPIAAVGLLNPMIAALAMAFSDVMVIGNSLRLKVKKIF